MEEKEIKKNNMGLIALVVILFIIIIGMGLYIAYDKGIVFSNTKKEATESSQSKEITDNDESRENSNEIKELDLSKCINNKTNTYSNSSDVEGNYGLSMEINSEKTSVTLSIDWSKFGPLSTVSTWPSSVTTYQVTGFSKTINSVFVGDLGQDSTGITLFYLMSDGTVEYTPMFNRKIDSQNNSYYEMNYTYDYSADGRTTGQHFSTKGTINGVSSVIKLYTVDASNGSGWRTTIGATSDGSFYDLGDIIKNN